MLSLIASLEGCVMIYVHMKTSKFLDCKEFYSLQVWYFYTLHVIPGYQSLKCCYQPRLA